MASSQGPASRLFEAAKRLLDSLLVTGETRLRLAILELEEERARFVTILLLAGLSMMLLLLGIATLTALVIVAFWESHRLTAIGVSALVLLVTGLALVAWVIRLSRRKTLLASTLRHLATDRELMEQSRDD